jgi:hypothetical protein
LSSYLSFLSLVFFHPQQLLSVHKIQTGLPF